MADPPIALSGVVNAPYIILVLVSPYMPSIIELVDSANHKDTVASKIRKLTCLIGYGVVSNTQDRTAIFLRGFIHSSFRTNEPSLITCKICF